MVFRMMMKGAVNIKNGSAKMDDGVVLAQQLEARRLGGHELIKLPNIPATAKPNARVRGSMDSGDIARFTQLGLLGRMRPLDFSQMPARPAEHR
jgi:hypothetical protein